MQHVMTATALQYIQAIVHLNKLNAIQIFQDNPDSITLVVHWPSLKNHQQVKVCIYLAKYLNIYVMDLHKIFP